MRYAVRILLAALFAGWGVNAIRAQVPDLIGGREAPLEPESGRGPRRMPSSPSPGLCTDPLPGVAAPNAPHGIFVSEFPGEGVVPVYDYILNQPQVCGGSLYVVWKTVDKGNGQYDWTSVDAEITPWTAAGKRVNLIVWAVSDSDPNDATPDYVLQAPGFQSVTCNNYSYPVYYLDPYKSYLKTFIQAVLERYGANPNVGYIRFGLGRGGEAGPTCEPQLMTLSGFSTQAQFDTEWESYITEMTQFQKTLQEKILASSRRVVQLMAALNDYGTPLQESVPDFEAQNAVSLGFGFGSQGLRAGAITKYQSGQPCESDWCAMFKKYAGQAPLELQTISASDPTNAAGGTGSLTVLFPFALSFRTQIFEVYIPDLLIAYDPANPNYAQYGKAYQQVFEQVAETVGYGSKP
jgi:hypothetical protein